MEESPREAPSGGPPRPDNLNFAFSPFIHLTGTQSLPQTQWSQKVSNEPREEGALLRKWKTVDSDQKATPPNVVCSKIGTIEKSK